MSWEIVAGILIFLAVFITGGFALRFYKEGKEAKEAIAFLFDVFIAAIKDYELTPQEKVDILAALVKAKKECKDVGDLAAEVANAFTLAKKKI